MKMVYVKEIQDYLDYYEKAPNMFNNKRKLLIENIVKPLLKRDDIFFDEETFHKCIRYCERWYYKLFPYEKFIYAFVFMYKDDIPIFRTFVIIEGRGNGKDGFIIPLVNFLQTEYYGIKNYNIDIVATSEEQAKNTYKVTYQMLENNKKKFKSYFYWNREECINKKTKSTMRFNTSNAKTKDGKQDGAIVYNEYHAYETDEQIKVFQSGLGKIKHPRIFIITTNGYVRGGPLDELLDVCEGVLNGESNELRYFPFICEIDSEEEADNPEMWHKANPSLEFMPVLQDAINLDYLEMKKFPSKRAEFMTKRMNFPQRNEEETITSWEKILKASFSDVKKKIERQTVNLEGKSAVVGIDFASLNDFACAGFLFKVNGEYIWRSKTWICAKSKFFKDIKFPFDNKGQPGFNDYEVVYTETIDAREMISWIIAEMPKYNVKKIVLDTYRYKLLEQIFIEKGITIESKDTPYGLVRMIRYPASIAAIVAPRIEAAFAEEKINIGDSAMMRWSINNTCVKNKKDGNKSYEKIEPKLRKNDTFMAFVAAMSVQDLLEEQIIYV